VVLGDRTSQRPSVERGGPSPLLRGPAEQEVSPLELLFDLVFVLGVSQLTRHLVTRPTWRGASETLVLYLPVFAVWAYTSWAATLYSPSHSGARRMVIAVMAVGMFMNASVTRAFRDAAWVFVVAFLGIQLGRTAWMLTTRLDPINRDHFVRTLAWLAANVSSVDSGRRPFATRASGCVRFGRSCRSVRRVVRSPAVSTPA
jgi:low temperature requirement protein LtrA